jgi:RimJ/RimL family protein N-acetyltransferase
VRGYALDDSELRALDMFDLKAFRHEVVEGLAQQVVDVATGSIAFVVDPAVRRRGLGLGRAMISALMRQPDLSFVKLFEAGVEPENTASRRCLDAAAFRLRTGQPDCEGMLYYERSRH